MTKRLLLCLSLLLLVTACSSPRVDDTPEPGASIENPDPSRLLATSSDGESGEVPPQADPPALTDVVSDVLDLGVVDGITFLMPPTDEAEQRHAAVYQSYSTIVLTLPFESPIFEALGEEDDRELVLGDLEARVQGLLLYPEAPEAVAVIAMPVDGYNALLADLKIQFAAAVSSSFEAASAAVGGFSVYDEDFAAVRLYVARDSYDDLTEDDRNLARRWAAYCLAYQELLGVGENLQIPIYFEEAMGSEPYETEYYPG